MNKLLKFLLVTLCFALSPKVFADWTNADGWNVTGGFKVTHVPTLDQPYYTVRYPSLDEEGTDDYLMHCRLYAGSDEAGYASWVKNNSSTFFNPPVTAAGTLFMYHRRYYAERSYYNSQIGRSANTGREANGDKYSPTQSFYPSDMWKRNQLDYFFFRMTGFWDYDDDWGDGYWLGQSKISWGGDIGDDFSNKSGGDGLVYYAPAKYDVVETEEPVITRYPDGSIYIYRTNVKEYSKWTTHYGFTYSSATPENFLEKGIDAGSFEVKNGEVGDTVSKPEGWDPTETYTLYYHKYLTRTEKVGGENVNQGVDGTIVEYKMPGAIYPTNFECTPEKWKEQIVLKWSVANDDAAHNSDGDWYVFRKAEDESGYTKLASFGKGQTNYIDGTVEMDKQYTYCVTFVPKVFGEISEPHNSKLTASATASVNRSFTFPEAKAVTSNQGSGGIFVTWQTEKDNHEVKLQKYDESSNQWKDIYVGTATSYTDEDVESLATYKYRVKATHWDRDFYSKEIEITYMSMSEITSITASQGLYANMVKVNWNVKQLGTSQTRYVVSRRLLTDPNSVYTDIYEVLGTASSYYFEDVSAQAGQYYYYKVTAYAKHPTTGGWTKGNSLEADGFNVATGIISGRVAYGSGTAVSDAIVRLSKNIDDDDNTPQFFAYQSTDASGVLSWQPREEFAATFLQGKPFTIQCWARADQGRQTTEELPLITLGDQLALMLGEADGDMLRPVLLIVNGQTHDTGLKAKDDKYYNYSLVCEGANYQVLMSDGDVSVDEDKRIQQFNTPGDAFEWKKGEEYATVRIAADNNGTNTFIGNVDDIRVWDRALTNKEVLRYYNRILSGSEAGLLCYWPLDEGVDGIPFAYDYSKTNGIINGNHALLSKEAAVTSSVPSQSQLSLYGVTDEQGNYTIRGVPFSGEGTSYTITPILGVHEFNPHYTSRYISNNSLTHSGVDFSDVSSFPVSGTVMYEGTTIPVEGAYLYVDGVIASRDGESITTNNRGEFVVDVPIGDHFISVKSNGHDFLNGGRYPADPEGLGLRHTFEGAVSNINFVDQTLVPIGGRVAGGKLENEKPVGVGAGKANIGQAKIQLAFVGNPSDYINAKLVTEGLSQHYEMNDVQRDFQEASDSINSKVYVAPGKNMITIETDSETGEWSALVPPLKYTAELITIPSQPDIDLSSRLFVLDATHPLNERCDSIESDQPELDGYARFKYVDQARVMYQSPSHLDVTENEDGSFGDKVYTVVNQDNGTSDEVELYNVLPDGSIEYTFGAPIYQQKGTYAYDIFAYEKYVNKDGEEPEYDIVPLSEIDVTIKNEFAATTSVEVGGDVHEVMDETFALDSLGRAKYVFSAGLPNIAEPYTRTLNISYDIDGTEMSWDQNGKFAAVVLGALPKGNNFVTQGPDEVLMVLRDPPGTGSKATWTKGTTVTHTKERTFSRHAKTATTETLMLGFSMENGGGVGIITLQKAESKANIEAGFNIDYSEDHGTSSSTTVKATRDISTGDSPDYVGANGDVFIGSSKNIILGAANNVNIYKSPVDGTFSLYCKEAMSMGEEFTTEFVHTSTYVKDVLIPEFKDLRAQCLRYIGEGGSVTSVARPAEGASPIYVTTISPDDERFGSRNSDKKVWGADAVEWEDQVEKDGYIVGPSYTIVMPNNYESKAFSDTISYFNNQIEGWEATLRNNEAAKVIAIEERSKYLIKNYSFDSGATITESEETSSESSTSEATTYEYNWHAGLETGFSFGGAGLGVKVSEDAGMTYVNKETDTSGKSECFSYSLVEDGNNDYLSVDILKAPDGFSPIFYTRAGATSNPFEDEVVTEYYRPGFVVQQKTLQIEKPEISVLDPVVTGVPAGKEAKVRIVLRNNSESNSGLYYGLKVMPATNANGAQVFMDGKNIAEGIELLLQGGEQMQKTLTIRQSDEDILEYEDLVLRMYSLSQREDGTGNFPGIYSDQTVSVYFQPSCTDIELAATTNLVNTETEAPVILSMSGYDYNQTTFQEIRLQYKGENDANFKNLQVFVKDETKLASDPSLKLFTALTGTDKLTFSVDLRENDFYDQTYIFRAQTVGYRGGNEVTNESEEVRIVRDMSRPQLIANPTPANGVLTAGGNITLTFNEDIASNILNKATNFVVTGTMNETEVAHEVAMDLTGVGAAKTAATIDLSDRPFSANLWINYTADGTILQHGTAGNNFTASIREGKLVLAVGDDEVVSTETLPTGKWLFLAFNYDNAGVKPVVSASYAKDADIVSLFESREIAPYEGNGPLTLGGNGMKAHMQELTLWNSARSIDEALADRSTTKNPYTSGLIGYWQLSEGHGAVASDRARSRDLTLPAENAWYINGGENYAVQLDGATAVEAPVSTTAGEDDSYMVELWFNIPAKGASNQTIVSLGNFMDVNVNAAGQVVATVGGTSTTAYATDVCDGQWHHLALNVLKGSNGAATLFIDGQARKQFGASLMPALGAASHIVLGARQQMSGDVPVYDQYMKGSVDELRVWNGRRTADVVKSTMYQRVADDAEGLEAYYPMEVRSLDEYGQIVTTSTATEMKAGNMSGLSMTANSALQFATDAPALASAPSLENVQFDYVASERQITINLGEEPYKIENCNVNLTVKNVKDLNGNSSQPITWTIFVQQNQIKWVEDEINIETVNGESKTFTVEIENTGATSDSWTLKGIPSWLTVNAESGNLAPQGTQKLRFSFDPSTAVGSYEATIYLTGSQNIDAPLNITLKVKGDEPDWNPMPDEETMNVVAQINVDGVVCSDPDDILAAFRGQECVGVARPTYSSRYDAYFIMMNIYGNSETEGAALTYKFYDASKGIIYPSVTATNENVFKFKSNVLIGSFQDWVVFNPENKIEQDLSLGRTGWKWFSMYVSPTDKTLTSIFTDAAGKIDIVKDHDESSMYKNDGWAGSLSTLGLTTMYKLRASEAYEETAIGTPADPSLNDITIEPEVWTWIGYPVSATNSVTAAFADANPQDGDIVKNQSSFATYDNGGWAGSLTTMIPGEGYKYYSAATSQKTFNFQAPVNNGSKRIAARPQTNVLCLTCEDNMSVIADVVMNGEPVENATISVYAGDELCGYSAPDSEKGLHFLTVGSADSGSRKLRFIVETEDEAYVFDGLFDFRADAVIGTVKNPFILNLDMATDIDSQYAGKAIESIEYYDLTGRLISAGQTSHAKEVSGKQVALKRVIYSDGTSQVFKTVE